MNVMVAIALLILVVTAGSRKKKKPDDLPWIDRLEEWDAIFDDD